MFHIYFGVFIGSLLGIAISKYLEVKRDAREERVVSALKDGLLALAATQLHKNDVDDVNNVIDYALYDGNRLPWLGCFARLWFIERLKMLYFGDRENAKEAAIQKYFVKNFGNLNDAESFFEKVVDVFTRAEALTRESCVGDVKGSGFGEGEIQAEGACGDYEACTGNTLGNNNDIDWEDGCEAVDSAESKKEL